MPRFTGDVDLAVAVESDSEAERVVGGLLRRGYRLFKQLEHIDTHRFATARMLLPPALFANDESPVVDLLLATAGIEKEVVAEAEILEVVGGQRVPVARIGHLLALKLLSEDPDRRPLDAADIVALLRKATPADLMTTRSAVALIESRGYARGKDLALKLSELLKRHGMRG